MDQTNLDNNTSSEKTFSTIGAKLELESLRQEYLNSFDRSNKLDNKVYITVTFCGFLFVFITNLFGGISKLHFPSDLLSAVLTIAFLISCAALIISYVWALIYFMRMLQPEHLIRIDPDKLELGNYHVLSEEEAYRTITALYRNCINSNLEKLAHRCDEFVNGLHLVTSTVILAFSTYVFQLVLQIVR